jgi:hypothetical protein
LDRRETKLQLRDLYSSPSIIRIIKSRRMRWAGHVAQVGKKRNTYRLLVRKSEGKRPLGRPRHDVSENILSPFLGETYIVLMLYCFC